MLADGWSYGDRRNTGEIPATVVEPRRRTRWRRDGRLSASLADQATVAAGQDPDYVTIQIGANDACASPPTPLGTFRSQVEVALAILVTGNPKVYIQMASIPDINRLHTIFTNPPDPNALARWDALKVCQGLLAKPLSNEPTDLARRTAFRERVIAYNAVLEQVCDAFKRCRFDDNAVFNATFTAADVATVVNTSGLDIFPFNILPIFGSGNPNSTADYFHPSLQGQARLAEITWNATFRDFVARGKSALARG